jgi:hypothetical protein
MRNGAGREEPSKPPGSGTLIAWETKKARRIYAIHRANYTHRRKGVFNDRRITRAKGTTPEPAPKLSGFACLLRFAIVSRPLETEIWSGLRKLVAF